MMHRALHRSSGRGPSWSATIFSAAGFLCTVPVAMAQDAGATAGAVELLSQARSTASAAARHVDETRQIAQRVTRDYDTGTSSFVDFSEAQLALFEADMRLKIAELDVAEIEAGGGPVRLDLAAPLVDGRDFLSERLRIEFDVMARRSQHLEMVIKVTEAEVEAGVAMPNSIGPLTIERSRLAVEAERIRMTLELRHNEILMFERARARQ